MKCGLKLSVSITVLIFLNAVLIFALSKWLAPENQDIDPHSKLRCSSLDFHDVVQKRANQESRRPDLNRTRALVVGGAEVLGSFVADFCRMNLGFMTVVLDDPTVGSLENLNNFSAAGGFVEIGDLQNMSMVQNVFLKHGPFGVVYLLASRFNADQPSSSYEHSVGVMNVIHASARQSPRVKLLVLASTASLGSGELGSISAGSLKDSRSIANLAMELELQAVRRQFGINFVVFRLGGVIGWSKISEPRKRSLFDAAMGISRSKSILYVEDVARIMAGSVAFEPAYNREIVIGSCVPFEELPNEPMETPKRHSVDDSIGRDSMSHPLLQQTVDQKLQCLFNPPPPLPLREGLLRMSSNGRSSGGRRIKAASPVLEPKQLIVTDVVMFVPTPIPWGDRRKPVLRQFLRERWDPSEVRLIFVVGTRTGPRLEEELDLSIILKERKEAPEAQVEYLLTSCRDEGNEWNNANGTSATTCKVYEACVHIARRYRARFVWRGADDAYVNLKLFRRLMPLLPKTRLFLGYLRKVKIQEEQMGLVGQPNLHELFGLYQFGQYMLGIGFLFSWDVAEFIGSWTIPPHQTWCEDVMVGMWLNPFQIKFIDFSKVDTLHPDLPKTYGGSWREGLNNTNQKALVIHYIEPYLWQHIREDGMILLP
jgi:nucleoside-diphosphate-sugar epimerase